MHDDRRRFLFRLAAAGTAGLLRAAPARAATGARVVVVGGGFAGATAAKYLRLWDPSLAVTLIVRAPDYVSCPLSNLVLGGSRTLPEMTFNYDTLARRYDVRVVVAEALAVDPVKRAVETAGGPHAYDRVILAPGIGFRYEDVPGLETAAWRESFPHAWVAGRQTELLRAQLLSLAPGGRVVMTIPPMPFRCPAGPYERVCQIAFYLKFSKPGARLIVLDANPDIVVKPALFRRAFEERYAGVVEYRPGTPLLGVDGKRLAALTPAGAVSGDLINIIPPQRAGDIARAAGVTDAEGRWCPVDFRSYESVLRPGVHVIGDAIGSSLPKSAHLANGQAKICAHAVLSLLRGEDVAFDPVLANTCYSWVSAGEAMNISSVYRYDPSAQAMRSVGAERPSESANKFEAYYAQAWAKNIWHDSFG